jgi:hypothetical protein
LLPPQSLGSAAPRSPAENSVGGGTESDRLLIKTHRR